MTDHINETDWQPADHLELIAVEMDKERDRPPIAHPPAHWHPRVKYHIYAPQLSGRWQELARDVFAKGLPKREQSGRAYGFADLLSDEGDDREPMVGRRVDGQPLFYKYAYNILWGPPQARKSWVAILAIKQVVTQAPWPQRCVYFDYEDNAHHFKDRLRLIGCGPAELVRPNSWGGVPWVDYRSSPGDLRPDLVDRQFSMLESFHGVDSPAIIVIDGVEAFCTAHDCASNSNQDWGMLVDEVLAPLCRTGAAVVLIDHVAKGRDANVKYPIGASQKLARCRGAAYEVSSVSDTVSNLVLRKDTNGRIGASSGSKVAELVLEDGGVYSPKLALRARVGARTSDAGIPALMEKGSRALESEDGLALSSLRDMIGGRRKTATLAIDQLVVGGHVRLEHDGTAHRHYLVTTYRQPI
jgi:AAA domain